MSTTPRTGVPRWADPPTSQTVGSNDICFRFAGPVSEVLDMLETNGIDVVDGPVPRPASNGERG